jgi:glycosyltransferase involved in cell wall biosynthesis
MGRAGTRSARLFSDLPPDRIDWLGELPQQEVAAILAASAVYVWPGRGEAFGLAYLEAQAAGLPVVAMETAGVPEVVTHGETGWLTPDGDVDAYAAAIRRLLGNGDERGRLGRNGRRRMRERHSLDAAAERLRNLLPERMPAR